MTKWIVGVAVLAVLGVGGYAWYANSQAGAMMDDTSMHDAAPAGAMHDDSMASSSDSMMATGTDAMMAH